MNLYIFNETRTGAVYGVGTYIRELTASLKNSDVNLCVINLNSDKRKIIIEQIDGIKYWFFPAPLLDQHKMQQQKQWELYHRNVVYLLQLYIKYKKNLIFHLNYNQKGQLADELKKVFDCRIVTTIHYLDWCLQLSGNVHRFREILASEVNGQFDDVAMTIVESYRLEKKLFETVDCIICLSKHTQLILQHDYHIACNKIVVIYNGLTESRTVMNKMELLQKYHFDDIPILLFVGRLDDIKGLKYALRAFRDVLNTHLSCHFIIAGDGSFSVFMKECEDIWKYVTWTGLIGKDKLYDLYSIADIGVMPSFHEQCSYVAIEMMMHGIPLIASTSTGLKEMVEDGITGYHIPVKESPYKADIDTRLLAEKILFLLQHPEERERIGQNARKRYEEHYLVDKFRKNMLNFYKSLFME